MQTLNNLYGTNSLINLSGTELYIGLGWFMVFTVHRFRLVYGV